jgi:hypothetical protein
VTADEALDIARLLLRLSLAAPSLKVGIIAGRVYGELLAQCSDTVPALHACFLDLGRAVACLLEAFARGGPAVWLTASLGAPSGSGSGSGVVAAGESVGESID